MKRLRTAALLLLPVALLAAPSASAEAATDRTLSVSAGSGSTTWKGTAAPGLNAYYFGVVGDPAPATLGPLRRGTCGKTVTDYCDSTLLELSNPLTDAELAAGKTSKTRTATITIGEYAPVPDPATDFDLVVWAVDAAGNRTTEVARDGDQTDTANETVSFSVKTTPAASTVRYVVDVVYFASAGSGFTGRIGF